MQFRDQLEALWASDDPKQTHDIKVGDRRIPVRLLKADTPTKNLIIVFHGAVNRDTREVPAFVNFSPLLTNGAHQLAISDPTMLVEGDFSLSWYAGDQDFAAQDILKTFFAEVSDVFDVERVIYFGTSGGGFAALYYGWHHPGSIVVAGNPQTRITDYYSGHTSRYQKACWPDDKGLDTHIHESVRDLYASAIPNFVIYVQSATDPFHLVNHLAPFVNEIGFRKDLPLIVNVDYFGKMGHSPTFDAYVPWLKAAMTVSDVSMENLVKAKHLASGRSALTKPAKASVPSETLDAEKIQTADMIRDWQLGDTTSWPQTPTNPSNPEPSGVQPSPNDTSLISKIFGRRSR